MLSEKTYFQTYFQSGVDTNPNYKSGEAAVDWRTKGAISPMKNEGNCKSSWALALVSDKKNHYCT